MTVPKHLDEAAVGMKAAAFTVFRVRATRG